MMDRKTAEGLMSLAIRETLLVHLDEVIAFGKKAKLDKARGQESLFEDEEETDKAERDQKISAEIMQRFEVNCEKYYRREAQIALEATRANARARREEPDDEWACASCGRPFPKGIDEKACPCGSRFFTRTSGTSPEDERIFWEYHRKMAKAGK